MKKILVLNNNDSFVYNLVEYFRTDLHCHVDVCLESDFRIDLALEADGIVLSPGPGLPSEYPQMQHLLCQCAATKPILGVCLGHQAIATHYGGVLKQLEVPKHGHCSTLHHLNPNDPLFHHIAEGDMVGRYHSWVIDRNNVPPCLEVTAEDEEGHIMAIRHQVHPVWGVQFHPESILTQSGKQLLKNWLERVGYFHSSEV